MGEAPPMSILQSTLKRTPEQEPDVVLPEQPAKAQSPVAAPKAKAAAGKVAKPASVTGKKGEASPGAGKKAGVGGKTDKDSTQDNPFGYDMVPTWPLVSYEKPFLIQVPENQGRAAAALSIRIPLDLNQTVERHCAKLGVKNTSQWVREAMERQLALEQQHLAKKQG